MKLWIRPVLTVVVGLVAAVLFFYLIENWRGARAYRLTMEELRERGEPLVLEEHRSGEVARASAVGEFLEPLADPDPFAEFREAGSAVRPTPAGWGRAFVDANAELGFAAGSGTPTEIYLEGTSELGARAEEYLGKVPSSVGGWGIDFSGGFATEFPHLTRVLALTSLVQKRALAHLLEGDSEAAFRELGLLFQAALAFEGYGVIIESLVGYAIVQQALVVLNVGMQEERWSAEMLAEIEDRLARIRPMQSMVGALQGERMLFLSATDGVSMKALARLQQSSEGGQTPEPQWQTLLYDVRPSGWTDSDRALYARTIQEWIDDLRLAPERGVDLTDFAALPQGAFQTFQHPLTSLALPSLDGAMRRALRVENDVRLAELSCAIEQFCLEEGRLPENATEVASLTGTGRLPEDLPHAQPVKYQKTGETSYLLYGLGLNGTDEGGSPEGRGHQAKDWVWAVELTEEEDGG